ETPAGAHADAGGLLCDPPPEPPGPVVVVPPPHDPPAQPNVPAAHRHPLFQPGQILLRGCPRQVADRPTADLHGNGVRVIRIHWLWNQHRDDVAADPVSDGPPTQSP